MWPRWNSIVFGLRNSEVAMLLFVRPSATIVAICASWAVSSRLRARGPRWARPPLERSSRAAFSAHGAAPSDSKRSMRLVQVPARLDPPAVAPQPLAPAQLGPRALEARSRRLLGHLSFHSLSAAAS